MTPSSDRLILVRPGGQESEISLLKAILTLGRAEGNDIVLTDPKASRSHARLERGPEGWTLTDSGSANGTRVNGVRVERATLQPGDVIALGDTRLRLQRARLAAEPEMARINSEAELQATLAQSSLSMTMVETRTPRLTVHLPGKTWEAPLTQDALTIGRAPENDVVLTHPKVSRRHARIERRGEAFVLRDLGSANGVWLGERRLDEHELQDGETIRIGDARLAFKRGFAAEDVTRVEAPRARAGAARQPVVIVPGMMGSQLWRGGERVWPDVRLMFTQPELFRLPEAQPLEPRGLVEDVVIVPNLVKQEQYGRLGDFLEEGLGYERGKDLFEFAYDWRQDVRQSARRLAEMVDGLSVAPPITLIAHSLGCLVSRYCVERLDGKSKVGRLILMGGPHAGVPKAITTLLLGPDLLPFGMLGERLRQVLATFPSAYQILPTYPCALDDAGRRVPVLTDEAWLPETFRPMLRAARGFRRELGTRSSVPAVSIFGYGLKTITGLNVQRDLAGLWNKVDFSLEPSGDTTIPERSTVLEGSEIHPVQQYHESLYVDGDVKMRLRLELTRGA